MSSQNGIKVLSLFDGMSCGRIAFERANIKVASYHASEIDKYAIKVTQANYPDTTQLGSITEWKSWDIENPDIIIGGSPCQGFSFAGKGLNFDDPRSKLFFTFVEILKHYKPKYFLLENVIMKKEHNDVISGILGEIYPECVHQTELFRTGRLEPIEINSALVSAQNRRRLYWTNIPGITQPEDKGILLKDIIENEVDDKFNLTENRLNYQKNNDRSRFLDEKTNKAGALMTRFQGSDMLILKCAAFRGRNPENPTSRKSGLDTVQMLEIRQDEKTNTLTGVQKDNILCYGKVGNQNNWKKYENKTPTLRGLSRCNNIPMVENNIIVVGQADIKGGNQEPKIAVRLTKDGYHLHRNDKKKSSIQGTHITFPEGKTHCLNNHTPKIDVSDKSSTILSTLYKENLKSMKDRNKDGLHIGWRKLTPLECERLQTVNTIYEIEVELCEDQIKNYVNVVEKNHRLQKLVLSVEKKELKEFAKLVGSNMKQNYQQIKHIVPQNVDILIQKKIKECMNHNQEEKNIIVDFVEKKMMSSYQNIEEDFVTQNVFTNIIQEKTINFGKVELHLKDKNSCYLSSGRKQLKLYGNEIMQLVEIVGTFSENQETGKCTYTTLYHLNIKNIEQMLIILYWYAKIVIDIFTQRKTSKKNISLSYSFENSYTNHVSNSQRYKMLGNGWTVDVIAHIFSFIPGYK